MIFAVGVIVMIMVILGCFLTMMVSFASGAEDKNE